MEESPSIGIANMSAAQMDAAQVSAAKVDDRADWLGVACSFGCAIHCAATPILLSVLPAFRSVSWLADPLFHQVVAVICFLLVLRAILPGMRIHRDFRVASLAGAGLGLLLLAAFVLPDRCCQHESEQPTSAMTETKAEVAGRFQLVSSPLVAKSSLVPGAVSHDHSHAGHSHAGHSHAGHAHDGSSPVHEHSDEEGTVCPTSHWGTSLLSEQQLVDILGPSSAHTVGQSQPWLSPIGGMLLIFAHILNMRMQCRHTSNCKHE